MSLANQLLKRTFLFSSKVSDFFEKNAGPSANVFRSTYKVHYQSNLTTKWPGCDRFSNICTVNLHQ